MNGSIPSGRLSRLRFQLLLGARRFEFTSKVGSFGSDTKTDAIERIYVINLDRQPQRWRLIGNELSRLKDRSGKPLAAMARRFSAVDAQYLEGEPDGKVVQPHYSLADQLFVQPDPLLAADLEGATRRIEMTPQEIAVALSHVEIWKLVAEAGQPYALVLEDDIYFCRGFGKAVDAVWADLIAHPGPAAFDLLYLSYTEAGTRAITKRVSKHFFQPIRGLWQLSGYVLSQRGARRLLDSLPVRGPVDLWLNHQFKNLEVLAVAAPLIKQRPDCTSSNSYSILPVLSQVGVIRRERPSLAKPQPLPGPIFAFGRQGTGLTALAMALSMVGYRCCSDLAELPMAEHVNLLRKHRARVFDAYVNVGSLKPCDYQALAKRYPNARFIVTTDNGGSSVESPSAPTAVTDLFQSEVDSLIGIPVDDRQAWPRLLVLPARHHDKWELLRTFLGCEYPSHRYPRCQDRDQRKLAGAPKSEFVERGRRVRRLRYDRSPWIVARNDWHGLSVAGNGYADVADANRNATIEQFETVDTASWLLRDDTFPSNLAIFRPRNFSVAADRAALLTLRAERSAVRDFTSAAIASRRRNLYGRFAAELRPSSVSGLITGMFLHRNSPRQEIDIELLGKNPSKMLVNVYYNPGEEGAKFEYGYRGTPALIDLGFDASQAFHRYEIEWTSSAIRWRVDDEVVYERVDWDPTPIPHLPMQFNINLWHSRSRELAGKLDRAMLPAHSAIRRIELPPISSQLAGRPAGDVKAAADYGQA
jgi:GR25 family glycosyltransferase involved in LPS biosynthesis